MALTERDESKALLLACVYCQYMDNHPFAQRDEVEKKFSTKDTEHLRQRAWEMVDRMRG